MNESSSKSVLIIDRQSYWRDKAAAALRDQGYSVRILSSYDYEPAPNDDAGGIADLVILGCPRVSRDERDLINRILSNHQHLVVFCSSLPWGDMRTLFMAGADDVADKPYDPAKVISVVQEVFANIAGGDKDNPQEPIGAL
jgi:DNA-binding response OmpR family regulator